MSFLKQSHQVFFGHTLSNSLNRPRYIMFDPAIINFSFIMTNHFNLLCLIIKLTGSNHKSSVSIMITVIQQI